MRSNISNSSLDNLEIAEFFENDFDIEYGNHDNGDSYGRISQKENSKNFIQFSIYPDFWNIDTLRWPWIGSQLLLTCFREAINHGIFFLELNARTMDESIKTQDKLEKWYRKFGFETISQDVDGTKMRAMTMNRPLEFRYKELVDRVLSLEGI